MWCGNDVLMFVMFSMLISSLLSLKVRVVIVLVWVVMCLLLVW